MFLLLSIKVTEGKSCSFGLLLVSLVNVYEFCTCVSFPFVFVAFDYNSS